MRRGPPLPRRTGRPPLQVGGSEAGLAAATPILDVMGKRIVHCGAHGAGQAAKLCNNLAMAVEMAGVAEALACGLRLGLDPVLLSQIFASSSARCWSSDTYNPCPGVLEGVPSSRGYKPGFRASLMSKVRPGSSPYPNCILP